MKKSIIFLLCLVTFSSISQNNLMEKYNLMPWPKSIEENNSKLIIDSNLTISILGNDEGRVHNASIKFLRRLSGRTGVFLNEGFPTNSDNATIKITFGSISNLDIENDESYTLHVNDSQVLINASTDVGVIRALETLLQLTSNSETKYYFPGVEVNDEPRFVWRGLMIDVSRHFQPIDVIKRNLDAMASVKMNVFHWHLSDDQGYRVESKVYPQLHELASDGLFYTHNQIKDVVKYASNIGIRVMPEIDVPGHATAILTAFPQLGSKQDENYSIERFSGIFDPTLDPTNDETYVILEGVFTELASLFPDTYFHIGGDENEGKHWDENIEIQKFKKEHNLETNHDLQTYFNINLEKILNKQGKQLMGWDEIMTPEMPKTAIIHAWRGDHEGFSEGGLLIMAAKSGYKTVLSDGFYIDRMESIKKHYLIEPIGDIQLTEDERNNILGGEATMWSELVTPLNIDSRIWPRTAAIAERLWSQKEVNDVDNMLHRIKDVNFRLEELGITHIRNRDVILRNLTKNQDISSLIQLSKLSEPVKIYSRNEQGTEYKTYSPFTLFADACVVDAPDAIIFNKSVEGFLDASNEKDKEVILGFLRNWITNYEKFSALKFNPILNSIDPTFNDLASISKIYLNALLNKDLIEEDYKVSLDLLERLDKPFVDVELVVVESLEKLSIYLKRLF